MFRSILFNKGEQADWQVAWIRTFPSQFVTGRRPMDTCLGPPRRAWLTFNRPSRC